jgi:hypothetical protein
MRTVVASSQGTAQTSGSRMAEAVTENDRRVRRGQANQTDGSIAMQMHARRCSNATVMGNGQR